MAFTCTGCKRGTVRPTPDPVVCAPVILMEPHRPVRPQVTLRYKIEEGVEWFALEREGYTGLRDYIIQLEGSVEFAIQEIRTSNDLQKLKK